MWKYLPASVCSVDTAASILPSDSPASNPEPSAMSNGTSTVSKSSKPGSEMVSSTMPQSGTMSESSTAHPGVDAWISSLPAHRANHIQWPVKDKGPRTMQDAIFFQIPSASLAKYSREECIWKTCPESKQNPTTSVLCTPQKLSAIWPRSGTTVDGILRARQTQGPTIHANAGGLLPTPVADGDRRTNYKQGGTSLGYAARMFPTPRAIYGEHPRMKDPSHLTGAAQLFPTPSATKIWPNTMRTQDLVDHEGNPWELGRKPYDRRTGRPVTTALADVAHHWPTPSSGGESGGPHGIRGGSWAKAKLVENVGEAEAVAMSGGQLSATWVCWLMGIPLGWDSLEPLPEGAYAEWAEHMSQGTWWAEERGLPRLAEGQKDRVNRLKCLGNGIVPASGALAFMTLEGEA